MAVGAKRGRPRKSEPATEASSFAPYKILSIDKLEPYARNARTHSDEQVAQIAASILEFGFTNPVLVDGDEAGIIAGHGRVLAMQRLGRSEVPCIVMTGLTPQQRRALVLADNKIALNAGWDADLLKLELGELLADGFDVGVLGFGEGELLDIFAGDRVGLTDPDDAPAAPENPVSVVGDVWLMGMHRIVCGDSTSPAVVAAALAGERANLMVTDPPYGVNYDPAWRVAAGAGSSGAAVGKVLNDDRADWREVWSLFPGSVAYVWHGGLHAGAVAESLAASKFKVRAQIVWVKTRPVFSRGHYHWQHEPALYAVKDGEDDGWRFVPEHDAASYAVREGVSASWVGGRKQSTVWFIEHLKSDTGHGTQKPVACMQRPIENNSAPGEHVFEPFSGSGTTIIACEITGRHCHAIELSPAYVDVAVLRWQAFTGKSAVHAVTGKPFGG